MIHIWPTLLVALACIVAASIVTLWTQGWHIRRPRWQRDGKVILSVFCGVCLAPMLVVSSVVFLLSMAPVLVFVPWAAADVR